MKKSRRIVKKMSKKSLINKKALRYIIANSNLCKHAIRELELAGYSKEEDGPNKWMREQVIEAVALFSSHGIEDIARESMNDLVENASEKKYRFRLDYMDEELTVDEFIRGRMKKVVDSNIETMVESKAKSFVNELRKRYDMAFAAFVVDNMRKQNMLKEDKIAELLKDNPNEK